MTHGHLARLGGVVLAICVGSSANAQTGDMARNRMSDSPCPVVDAGPPSGMIQALLQPGAKPPAMAAQDGPGAAAALAAYLKKRDEDQLRDFANLCKYKAANAAAQTSSRSPRVVLMGDSITENWQPGDPGLFSEAIVDRGIGGQTTPQMVVRFQQDVVALKPEVVHIMAGTNNVAGNTGPSSAEDFKNDIRAMVDMARRNGIAVVLASIPPAGSFPWRPDLQPALQIPILNAWLQGYATDNDLVYGDYYAALVSQDGGGMKSDLTNDGVHPTTRGYAVMRPIFEKAIADAATGKRR
jgi:lysophospholipase L1-like esterase